MVAVNNPLVDPQFFQLCRRTPSGLTAIPELLSPGAQQRKELGDGEATTPVPANGVGSGDEAMVGLDDGWKQGLNVPAELMRTRTLEFVHLKFTIEAGSLLPLALK